MIFHQILLAIEACVYLIFNQRPSNLKQSSFIILILIQITNQFNVLD